MPAILFSWLSILEGKDRDSWRLVNSMPACLLVSKLQCSLFDPHRLRKKAHRDGIKSYHTKPGISISWARTPTHTQHNTEMVSRANFLVHYYLLCANERHAYLLCTHDDQGLLG
jgi:hypothetical protein